MTTRTVKLINFQVQFKSADHPWRNYGKADYNVNAARSACDFGELCAAIAKPGHEEWRIIDNNGKVVPRTDPKAEARSRARAEKKGF